MKIQVKGVNIIEKRLLKIKGDIKVKALRKDNFKFHRYWTSPFILTSKTIDRCDYLLCLKFFTSP